MSAVSFKQLSEFLARKRPTHLKKPLESTGVLYFLEADGNPCTTEQALNDALFRGRRTQPSWPIVTQQFDGRATNGKQ